MPKYEYVTLSGSFVEISKAINEAGQNGFRVIYVAESTEVFWAILERVQEPDWSISSVWNEDEVSDIDDEDKPLPSDLLTKLRNRTEQEWADEMLAHYTELGYGELDYSRWRYSMVVFFEKNGIDEWRVEAGLRSKLDMAQTLAKEQLEAKQFEKEKDCFLQSSIAV